MRTICWSANAGTTSAITASSPNPRSAREWACKSCACDCGAGSRRFRHAWNLPQDRGNNPLRCSRARGSSSTPWKSLHASLQSADLLKGIKPDEVDREDIIFAVLAPRNLAGWLRWLRDFPKGREPNLVLHLGYASERFGADKEIPTLIKSLERSGKFSCAPCYRQRHPQGEIHGDLPTTGGVPAARHFQTGFRVLQTTGKTCPLRMPRQRARRKRLHRDSHRHRHPQLERRLAERAVYFAEVTDAHSAAALAGFRSAKAPGISLLSRNHLMTRATCACSRMPMSCSCLIMSIDIGIHQRRILRSDDVRKTHHCQRGFILGIGSSRQGIGWLARDRDPASLAETMRRAVRELDAVASRCEN